MYKKVSLLSPFFFVYKFHIICLSETDLNSETSPDDDNLEIPGYNIIRKDHPLILNVGEFALIIKTHYLSN